MARFALALGMLLALPWARAEAAPAMLKASLRGSAGPGRGPQQGPAADAAAVEAWKEDPVALEAKHGQHDASPTDTTGAPAAQGQDVSLLAMKWIDRAQALAEAKHGQPDSSPTDTTAAPAAQAQDVSLLAMKWIDKALASAEAKRAQPDASPTDTTFAMADAKHGQPDASPRDITVVTVAQAQEDPVALEAMHGHAHHGRAGAAPAGAASAGWRVPDASDPAPPSDAALVGMVTLPNTLEENDANVEASRPFSGYAGSPLIGFHGPRALEGMAGFLSEVSHRSATASPEAIFACARDEGCLDVWGTDPRLLGRTALVTKVLRSWDMATTSTSTRCHMKSHLQDVWCHRVGDRTQGRVYMAYAVPAAEPAHPWLPLAYVCHSMPGDRDASGRQQKVCHPMSGRDFVLSP